MNLSPPPLELPCARCFKLYPVQTGALSPIRFACLLFGLHYAISCPLLPPANEVWGKVIFSEACVKNSVHGGGVPDQVPPPGPGRYPPGTRQVPSPRTRQVTPPGPGRYTPSPRDQAGTPRTRQVHPPGTRQVPPPGPGRYTPPGPGRYTHTHPRDQAGTPPRDTVNARAVRILLECNLVLLEF